MATADPSVDASEALDVKLDKKSGSRVGAEGGWTVEFGGEKNEGDGSKAVANFVWEIIWFSKYVPQVSSREFISRTMKLARSWARESDDREMAEEGSVDLLSSLLFKRSPGFFSACSWESEAGDEEEEDFRMFILGPRRTFCSLLKINK